jgi:DNA polymerase-1
VSRDVFLIVDASGLLYRSFFALPPLTSPSGRPTGALYGFIRSFLKVHQTVSPQYVAVVFDGPNNKQSRLALYPEYKATRKPIAPELAEQIEEAKTFCRLWGMRTFAESGVEADDTIASITHWLTSATNSQIYICSADKDLAQLVSSRVCLVNPAKDGAIIDEAAVQKEWGFGPSQLCDFLALVGDASDNVPGIEGIGEKTANSLLSEWGTLENILENADHIGGKKGERIKAGKESAILSKRLVTLDTSVAIPHRLSAYEQTASDKEAVISFFQNAGFKTLETLIVQQTQEPPPNPCVHNIVSTPEDRERFLHWLSQQKNVAIDCETTSIDEWTAELVGIGIAAIPSFVWYIPCQHNPTEIVQTISALLQKHSISITGHNIKYDLHVLARYGFQLPVVHFDTLIASWLLNAHERTHSLDDLALRYFHKTKIPIESLIGKGKTVRTMGEVSVEDVARYCAEDVEYTLRLQQLFEQHLQESGVSHLFSTIEMPLLPVLWRMEEHGVFVNAKKLQTLQTSIEQSLQALQSDIHQSAGEEFNINSPKILSEILFTKLGLPKLRKGKPSTNAEVLEELAPIHPIAQKILEYRQLEKLRSTYLETLPQQILPKTGRVHCRFVQSGTATGRLSCRDPNLQNIPVKTALGKQIREAFEPQFPNYVMISADYSQIELRILAHMSKDPMLVRAFSEGLDVHSMTAAELFSVPIEQVTEDMRRKAKVVNFGIIYGQQAFGLSKELHIPTKEAQLFIDTYFQRYQRVREVIEETKNAAHKTGFAETLTGRKRALPEINTQDFFLRAAQERLAVNTPFQGTAADIIKMAMISLDRWLYTHAMQTKMVLQIHDELLFEVPESEVNTVLPIIRTTMESVMPLCVPLKVDINIGKNWKEC